MLPRSHAESVPDVSFRRAVAAYFGALVAATALTTAVALDAPSLVLGGATLVAFAVGAAAGRILSSRVPGLPIRLGRTRNRRAALRIPALPFGTVALAAVLGRVGTAVGLAALASTIAIGLVGRVCSRLARTRAIDATTAGEPVATYRWRPPRSRIAEGVLLVTYSFLLVMNAYFGEWLLVLSLAGVGLDMLESGLAEGRFRPDRSNRSSEIRIYENGLVKRYQHAATFVPWDEVDHVRLRDGELVLDRGFFDVRFDSDALETPENVLAVIERQLSVPVVGS